MQPFSPAHGLRELLIFSFRLVLCTDSQCGDMRPESFWKREKMDSLGYPLSFVECLHYSPSWLRLPVKPGMFSATVRSLSICHPMHLKIANNYLQSQIWPPCVVWFHGLVFYGPVSDGTKVWRHRESIARHFHIVHLCSHIFHTVRDSSCKFRCSNVHSCFIQTEYLSASWSSFSEASAPSVSLPLRWNQTLEMSGLTILTPATVNGFDVSTFITTYFPIPLFAVLFFGYKFWNGSKMVDYTEMDFVSGSSAIITEFVSKLCTTDRCTSSAMSTGSEHISICTESWLTKSSIW